MRDFSNILEVLLGGIIFNRDVSALEVTRDEPSRELGAGIGEIGSGVCVRLGIVGDLLLLGEIPHKGDGVASPDLPCRDESARGNYRASEDVRSTLDAGSLHDDGALPNVHIIIDNATIEAAVGLNGHVLSNVN